MKRFRLKRELPTFHEGDEFYIAENGALYYDTKGDEDICAYAKHTLLNFPNILTDWFEPIEPKEPLINGDDARRMFRTWAEYVGAYDFKYDAERDCLVGNYSDVLPCRLYFSFAKMWATENLTDDGLYTTTELCGEEEK